MIHQGETYKDSQGNTYEIKNVKDGEVTYSFNGKGNHTVSETTILHHLDEDSKKPFSLQRIR